MERSVRFAVVCVGVSLLISCHPVEAWYKQSTGPSYYSVGRASGLLSGIRRSPYVRRSESDETLMESGETASNNLIPETNRQISILKNMAICVKDISPNLKSCELLRDGTGTFQCKADVFLTLDSWTACLRESRSDRRRQVLVLYRAPGALLWTRKIKERGMDKCVGVMAQRKT